MKGALGIMAVTLLVAATVVSCARAAPAVSSVAERVVVEREVEAPAAEAVGQPGYASDEAATLASATERMIVRTVELSMYVQDVEASFSQLQSLAQQTGGYVASANTWHQGEHLRARLTLRIPAEEADSALEQIRAMATEVERESTTGEDVTEEYTDLEARLRNLEATETELLALLTTVRERVGRAEDILAVHRELTNIRGQIEQTKGRMQYLSQMSALMTVHVELSPDVLSRPLAVGRWEPRGTAANAVRTLVQVMRFVVDAGIWTIIVGLPVLIVIAIPILILIWIVRAWRRRRRVREA